MNLNQLPRYDASVNPTGCCPKFNPQGWDAQELHFSAKPFVKARTRSVLHVPLNMSKVFSRVFKHIEQAGALSADGFAVLSRELSPWTSEHLFSVSKAVPGEAMTALSGDFVTRVFEGPYRQARQWLRQMQQLVRERNSPPGEVYFFYTTCPKCAAAYGKNYVVGVAALGARTAPAA